MKLQQILGASTFALMGLSAPHAAVAAIGPELGLGQTSISSADAALPDDGTFKLSRRGGDDRNDDRGRDDNDRDDNRGRGRGGDDDNGHHGRGHDRKGDDGNGSGRGRPRVPGGSGCDDPGDILEHPECRG